GGSTPPPGVGPMGGGNPPPPGGLVAPPGGGPNPAGPNAAEPAEPAGPSIAYLTINPSLKAMLDKLEEGKEPVLVSAAGLDPAMPADVARFTQLPGLQSVAARDVNVYGFAVKSLKMDSAICVLGWECRGDTK